MITANVLHRFGQSALINVSMCFFNMRACVNTSPRLNYSIKETKSTASYTHKSALNTAQSIHYFQLKGRVWCVVLVCVCLILNNGCSESLVEFPLFQRLVSFSSGKHKFMSAFVTFVHVVARVCVHICVYFWVS